MNYEVIDIKRVFKDENGKVCYEFNVLENGEVKSVVLEHDFFECQLNLQDYYDTLIQKRDDLNSELTKNDNISFLFKFAGLASIFCIVVLAYLWILGIIGWSFDILSKVILSILGGDFLGSLVYGFLFSDFDTKLASQELKKINNQLNSYCEFQEKCRTLKLENKKQMARDMNFSDNEISKKNLVQDEKIVVSDNPTSVLNLQVSPLVESLILDNILNEKSILLDKSKKIRRQFTPDRPNFYQNMEKKSTTYYPDNSDVPDFLRKK